jgi:hypothetical protein
MAAWPLEDWRGVGYMVVRPAAGRRRYCRDRRRQEVRRRAQPAQTSDIRSNRDANSQRDFSPSLFVLQSFNLFPYSMCCHLQHSFYVEISLFYGSLLLN